ncbi:putative oxidoreductase [Sinosporangium album]|uniref:Putative oxidoreductase n=1 Tax=Sinosporangium album TaxID=504805 RepID=A0A1G8E4E5_9ACTN|nr:DoxX family protein [Sinosporangium album]SDH64509.1 putative oxidoreductase [Sinosporangium album]
MDAALALLRLVLGVILICHAAQKSLGWFRGPGLSASAVFFESLGHRPGWAMTVLAALCELAAGVLLLAGFLTPLAAAMAIGTMLVAGISMVIKAGTVWNTLGGGEYPLFLAAVCAAVALAGPGAWSLDAVLLPPWPAAVGPGAVVLALVAAAVPVLRSLRHRPA